MKRAALLLLLLTASAAHAQMYKWKDDKGVTHFTETPPPASATTAEVKNYNTGGAGGADLPFELAEAVRSHPVVLYTAASCGAGCSMARTLLATRGIPYQEKTVASAADNEALKKAGGSGQVPLLLVGRSARLLGFDQDAWDAALSNAGYPASKMLPPGYSNPPPSPAAPAAPPAPPTPTDLARAQNAAAKAAAAEEKARRERDTPTNAPPNFRF